jgi:hypothetical protein
VHISRAIPRGSASAHTIAAIRATAQRCREAGARNTRRSNSAKISQGTRLGAAAARDRRAAGRADQLMPGCQKSRMFVGADPSPLEVPIPCNQYKTTVTSGNPKCIRL